MELFCGYASIFFCISIVMHACKMLSGLLSFFFNPLWYSDSFSYVSIGLDQQENQIYTTLSVICFLIYKLCKIIASFVLQSFSSTWTLASYQFAQLIPFGPRLQLAVGEQCVQLQLMRLLGFRNLSLQVMQAGSIISEVPIGSLVIWSFILKTFNIQKQIIIPVMSF